MNLWLAQLSTNKTGPEAGVDIANWADSPEKLALVWIIGGAILIAILILFVKFKMDKD